jgi:hypothetical protein
MLGANALLPGYLTRCEVLGLSLPVYNERMRAMAGKTPKTDF